MSEHFPGHEVRPSHEHQNKHEAHLPKRELAGEKHKESHSENLQHKRQEIEQQVEKHSLASSEIAAKTTEKAPSHHQTAHQVSRGIKDMTFERNMVRVRKQLNTPSKVLSKVIHQPVVDKVSEAAAKSVARPSGLLGGGMFSFTGTLLLFYLTRKYGYEFNYLVFFMLFVLGFILGATIELSIYGLKQRRNHDF